MSDTHNPEGGTTSPYGAPNPYGNQSPYGSQSPYGVPNGHDGNAASQANPASQPYPAPQPAPTPYYNPNGYPPPAQNWNVVPEAASNKATLSLVLGIVSFVFLGLFLSIPGYIIGKQAEAMGAPLGKTAKIVNMVSIGVSILTFVFIMFLFFVSAAGYHSTY